MKDVEACSRGRLLQVTGCKGVRGVLQRLLGLVLALLKPLRLPEQRFSGEVGDRVSSEEGASGGRRLPGEEAEESVTVSKGLRVGYPVARGGLRLPGEVEEDVAVSTDEGAGYPVSSLAELGLRDAEHGRPSPFCFGC